MPIAASGEPVLIAYLPNASRVQCLDKVGVGWLYSGKDEELPDASAIFECCLLGGEVVSGAKHISQVY